MSDRSLVPLVHEGIVLCSSCKVDLLRRDKHVGASHRLVTRGKTVMYYCEYHARDAAERFGLAHARSEEGE